MHKNNALIYKPEILATKQGNESSKKEKFDSTKTKDKILSNLQLIQNYLADLKVTQMVVSNISYFYILHENGMINNIFYTDFINESIRLGCCILANMNVKCQNQILDCFLNSTRNFELERYFFVGLQTILKLCCENIKKKENDGLFRGILMNCLTFIQYFCHGFKEGQDFLRQQNFSIKNVNLVYEITKILDFVIEDIKERYFYYLPNFEPKSFEKIFGKNYFLEQSATPRKFIDYTKIENRMKKLFILVLQQAFECITEIIRGPNINNLYIVMTNVSVDKINTVLEFFSAYFLNFKFKIKNEDEFINYYGSIVICQNYLDCLNEANPKERINVFLTGQKSIQTRSSSKGMNSKIYDEIKTEKNHKSSDIKKELSYLKSFYDQSCSPTEKALREIHKKFKSTLTLSEHKALFHQTLLEMENSLMKFLNYLCHSRYYLQDVELRQFKLYLTNLSMKTILDILNSHLNGLKKGSYKWKNIFQYYSLFLSNTTKDVMNFDESTENMMCCQKFLKWETVEKLRDRSNFLCSIEMVKDHKLQRIFYPVPQNVLKVWHLSVVKSEREVQLNLVSRSNAEEKIRDLFEKFTFVMHLITYQGVIEKFFGKSKPGRCIWWLKNQKNALIYFLMLASLIVNLIILLYSKNPETNFAFYQESTDSNSDPYDAYIMLKVFGIILTILSGLVLVIYIIDLNFLKFKLKMTQYSEIGKRNLIETEVQNNLNGEFMIGHINEKVSIWSKLNNVLKSFFEAFVKDGSFWVYSTNFVFCLIGCNYDPIFFAFCLIIILWENVLTVNVISSVLIHWDQFLATIIMSLIILYWYALTHFNATWRGEVEFEDKMNCNTLINCFRMKMDYGYTSPPVFSKNYLINILAEAPIPKSAIVWNFTFKLLVNLILSAIISGIIIDTFGEKRAKQEEIEEDNKNNCFICHLNTEDFERAGINFKYHVEKEHNMHQYIWFIHRIKFKAKSDLNDIEKYIKEMIERNEISFIPIKQAICLLGIKMEIEDLASLHEVVTEEFKLMRKTFMNVNEKISNIEESIKNKK